MRLLMQQLIWEWRTWMADAGTTISTPRSILYSNSHDEEDTDETEALSLINDPEDYCKDSSTKDLVKCIKDLQKEINKLQDKIKGLNASHENMKTEMLSRMQAKTDGERPENIQEGIYFGNGTNIPLQEVHQEST